MCDSETTDYYLVPSRSINEYFAVYGVLLYIDDVIRGYSDVS